MEKITNVKALEVAILAVEDAEVRAKLEHMKAQFEKKSATKGERKPTAIQLENQALREQILSAMEIGVLYTSKDIAGMVGMAESANRIAALMPALVTAGKVTKSVEKRVNFYSLSL